MPGNGVRGTGCTETRRDMQGGRRGAEVSQGCWGGSPGGVGDGGCCAPGTGADRVVGQGWVLLIGQRCPWHGPVLGEGTGDGVHCAGTSTGSLEGPGPRTRFLLLPLPTILLEPTPFPGIDERFTVTISLNILTITHDPVTKTVTKKTLQMQGEFRKPTRVYCSAGCTAIPPPDIMLRIRSTLVIYITGE